MLTVIAGDLSLQDVFKFFVFPRITHSKIIFVLRWIKPWDASIGGFQVNLLNVFKVGTIAGIIKSGGALGEAFSSKFELTFKDAIELGVVLVKFQFFSITFEGFIRKQTVACIWAVSSYFFPSF